MEVTVCSGRPILTPCGLKDFAFQVDPYIGCEHRCHYCYVLSKAETDWFEEIRMHADIAGRLRDAIDALPPQTLYMGTHTDPYQPCEADHRQTREVLAVLAEKGFSASILTKSDLVLRDIDLLQRMNDAAVSVSVAFNDDQTRRWFEAGTMETDRRVAALRRLKAAGVRTGALVCPVIPYITDAIELIERLAPCTDVIWIYGLSIEDRSAPSWLNVQTILTQKFPDVAGRVEQALFSNADAYWAVLRERLETLKENRRLALNIHL